MHLSIYRLKRQQLVASKYAKQHYYLLREHEYCETHLDAYWKDLLAAVKGALPTTVFNADGFGAKALAWTEVDAKATRRTAFLKEYMVMLRLNFQN